MKDLANVLDSSRLNMLRKLGARTGRDLLSELLEMFLDQTPVRLREMRREWEQGELSSVERLAHSLKGSSVNLGLRELAALSGDLEYLAQQGQSESCRTLIDAVESEYRRISALVRGALSGPKMPSSAGH